MVVLIAALLGALFNRIRGGWILPRMGGTVNVLAFGLTVYALSQNVWMGLGGAIAMWVGQQPGWGRYIGALGGWETKELVEWAPVDFFVRPFRSSMRLWGFFGLMLRGAFWGACLALPLGNNWAIVGGMTMPFWYLVGFAIARAIRDPNPQGRGWEFGELKFGAALWAAALIKLALGV